MTKVTDNHFNHLGPQGFHRVAYREWGDADNPNVLMCVHGVSRNARDFDTLAERLCDDYRLLCVDMPGRGGSDWMDGKHHYGQALYMSVCAALIARSGAEKIDWLGSSMGGRIGMALAAQPGSPIRKLVINDIGPAVSAAGRADNFKHFGTDPRFASEDEGIQFIRQTRTGFGPGSDQAWLKFCKDSLRQLDDGQWTLAYDPGLRVTAIAPASDSWDDWQRIDCPVLVLWGLKSKLLLSDTVARMRSTGPLAAVFEVPYAGHCPRLDNKEQIDAVREFLLR